MSTDITVPCPLRDFTIEAGASRVERFIIATAPDLTGNGIGLYWTARARGLSIVKSYVKPTGGGAAVADGIALRTDIGPGAFEVTIEPADTLALELEHTTLLRYDCWFLDASGAETALTKGTMTVRLPQYVRDEASRP